MRVLWNDMLADGTIVQVVEDEAHRRQIEIIDSLGASLATEVAGDCIRITVKSPGDRQVIANAIELAFGRIATKRPQKAGG